MVHIFSHSSAFFLFFSPCVVFSCSPSFIHHSLPPSTVTYKTHQEMEPNGPNALPVTKLGAGDDDDGDDSLGEEQEGRTYDDHGGEFGFKKKKKLVFSGGSGKKESAGADGGGVSPPRCQAEKCAADLTAAKRYHRRHKVCESHAKASAVVVAGVRQRFCQQCSRS